MASHSVAPTAVPVADEPPPLVQPARGVRFRWGEPLPKGHYVCRAEREEVVLACPAGDICCDDQDCRSPDEATDDNCHSRIECETNADCPASTECCIDSYYFEHQLKGGGGPMRRQWCAAKCREEPRCRLGTCPPGRTCNLIADPDDMPYVVGVCHRDDAQVACGAATCTGATPYCSWDATTATGTCVAWSPDKHRFECMDRDDCEKDEICALRPGWTACCRHGSCFDDSHASIPCATDRDRKVLGGGRCERFPPGEMPPGLPGACISAP